MKINSKIILPALALTLVAGGIGYQISQLGHPGAVAAEEENTCECPGGPRGAEHREEMVAIRTAIENNDYATWAELMGQLPDGAPMKDQINEATFANLQRVHSLMQEGKFEEAKQLREELGMPGPKEGRGGPRFQFQQNQDN